MNRSRYAVLLCAGLGLGIIAATSGFSKAPTVENAMTVLESATLTTTVKVPFERAMEAFADPLNHAAWDPTFFVAPITRGPAWNEARATVPVLGGLAHMRVDSHRECAGFDVYLARDGDAYGNHPAKVRILHNGDGIDILWTIYRVPGLPDRAWEGTQEAMRTYLQRVKEGLERLKVVS